MRSCWPGLVATLLVLSAPARAATVTDVATAADTIKIGGYSKDDPFDLWIDDGFRYVRETGIIAREPIELPGVTQACAAATPRACKPVPQLEYTRATMLYELHGQVGLYQDLAFTFGWSYVVDQKLNFGWASGRSTTDSTVEGPLGTLFQHDFNSVHRGSGKVELGLRWAPLSDERDDTKPKWLVSFEWAAPWAENTYNPTVRASKAHPGAVGDGLNYLTFGTALSKRLGFVGEDANRRGIAEPYFAISYVLPVPAGGSALPALVPSAARPFAHAPSQQAHLAAGMELVPSEDLRAGRKVAVDLGVRATYFGEGRNYSELTDPLARVTYTEQYVYAGAVLGLHAKVSDYLRLTAEVSYGMSTPHWLTNEEAGRDANGDGKVIDPALDPSATKDLWNPYYCGHTVTDVCTPSSSYDLVGQRFRAQSQRTLAGYVSLNITF